MTCRTCGTTLSAGALLCGECGASAIAPRPTLGDTARYDRRALLGALVSEAAARAAAPAPAPTQATPPAPPTAAPHEPTSTDPAPAAPPSAEPTPPAAPADPTPPAPAPAAAPPTDPTPRPAFTLTFSTGESIRVHGPGLVGRNPRPAEGEHVDYLVQLIDPQRSVSKTHLAFDVDGDTLWITDRHSSNGTRVVGPPDLGVASTEHATRSRSTELEPGVRIRVARGSRVGIGDEWFDVR
ncbi:FHA domain-containing protein [Herbiconiux sp. CPCC 205716]|uniref:FHA domain-containing protein n=1 Tax=Herbiconiux gentiana TaxID=2970912 RepID=A0ABT2GB76_9MICO|nr:FHA domain-containing protein [Herbiconiux gentiana]MCS5713393.1 FHA domain-containing protein [Herbiconiux gentiana]